MRPSSLGPNSCGEGLPWIVRTATHDLAAAPLTQKYLSSLYWAVATIVRNPPTGNAATLHPFSLKVARIVPAPRSLRRRPPQQGLPPRVSHPTLTLNPPSPSALPHPTSPSPRTSLTPHLPHPTPPFAGPDTLYEKWFVASVVVGGTIAFALIIGDVNAMVRAYDDSSASRRRRIAAVELFTEFHQVSCPSTD